MTVKIHPLDKLSAEEVTEAADAVKKVYSRVWFKAISLQEPAKAALLPYLSAEHAGKDLPHVERLAYVLFLAGEPAEHTTHEVIYSFDKQSISSDTLVDSHLHSAHDPAEIEAAEKALLSDPEFLQCVKTFKLPEGAQVCTDPWIYGCDTEEIQPRYMTFMVYFRNPANNDPDSNHYAHPLPLMPVMEMHTWNLTSLGLAPTGGTEIDHSLDDKPVDHLTGREYQPYLRNSGTRDDVKPYLVKQPDGPSFCVVGNKVNWQKWSFRVGFNYREGAVLHDLRYDGREVLYRMSVSDMTVPYGDPRAPYHRKQAFDLGDFGAGMAANELSLGCDCLGSIYYFDGMLSTNTGLPRPVKNVICLHEVDDGLAWKHTNFRTNRAAVARSRVLVIQMILTVSNYEYIFAYKLNQSGTVELETRATGILSTVYIKDNETSPYGNVVAPGVLATNHQHVFSIRIDPSIDGQNNTVVQEESVPMPVDEKNRYGVGYVVQKTPFTKSGWADAAPMANRIFKVINPNKINPISKRPIGYKLVPPPTQLMLAHPDSVASRRAEFGDHHIWVTKYRDGELFSGGNFTNQSSGLAKGIRTWVDRKDNVENTDVVLWCTFGLTHNPRVEDFPIMPCETHRIEFKPVDFFIESPSADLPLSTQAFNQSDLVGASMNGGDCCKR